MQVICACASAYVWEISGRKHQSVKVTLLERWANWVVHSSGQTDLSCTWLTYCPLMMAELWVYWQGIQEDYSSVYVRVNDGERLRIAADP